MKSVLLVDDEYYIRIRVRKCVDWLALGFDTVLDCEGGREALALMEERHFDLIILDISMPIMDGLALCKEIRSRGYDMQLIILTGYDKFEYAKSALNFDVLDYILKPIDGEELSQAVLKACERIDRKVSLDIRIKEHAVLKSQTEQMKSDMFFGAILTDSFMNRSDTAKQLRQYGIDPEKKYRIIYYQSKSIINIESAIPDEWSMATEINLPQGMSRIIEEKTYPQAMGWLQEFAALNLQKVYFGVSTMHYGTPEELHIAYKEARLIFRQQLLEKTTNVFCYDDYIGQRKILGIEKLRNFKASFNSGLQEQNLVQIEEAINGAFTHLVDNHNSIFGLHLFLENVLLEIQRMTLHMNGEWIGDVLFKMQAFELINSCDTLEQLKQQLTEIIAQCISQKNYFASITGSMLMKKVEQIVEGNYMDANLGLSSIAQALSLNASYLSDAFKRFYGQTLIQYITQIRMSNARDLLLSGNLNLVEVMERVGYTDPYYFSKRFKKFYGVSPSAYKRN